MGLSEDATAVDHHVENFADVPRWVVDIKLVVGITLVVGSHGSLTQLPVIQSVPIKIDTTVYVISDSNNIFTVLHKYIRLLILIFTNNQLTESHP